MATIEVELTSAVGPRVLVWGECDCAEVDSEVPAGWAVDWDTTPAPLSSLRDGARGYAHPLTLDRGTVGADDGYQGSAASVALTAEQEEIAGLSFQIADLEDAAQNAEDREQLGKASDIRAKARVLSTRLNALVAAQRAVQS